MACALYGRRLITQNDTLLTVVTMSSSIFVRLTPEAKHVVAVAAAKKGLSPAAFVRQAALEAAKHMGSELEPVEETLIPFLDDEREPAIKMRPVIRAADVLQPIRPASRPLLRADIERAALRHQPVPVVPTVDDVDISAFIQWQHEAVDAGSPNAEQNQDDAVTDWDLDDEPY